MTTLEFKTIQMSAGLLGPAGDYPILWKQAMFEKGSELAEDEDSSSITEISTIRFRTRPWIHMTTRRRNGRLRLQSWKMSISARFLFRHSADGCGPFMTRTAAKTW